VPQIALRERPIDKRLGGCAHDVLQRQMDIRGVRSDADSKM
jgi:hypothetical protein